MTGVLRRGLETLRQTCGWEDDVKTQGASGEAEMGGMSLKGEESQGLLLTTRSWEVGTEQILLSPQQGNSPVDSFIFWLKMNSEGVHFFYLHCYGSPGAAIHEAAKWVRRQEYIYVADDFCSKPHCKIPVHTGPPCLRAPRAIEQAGVPQIVGLDPLVGSKINVNLPF